MSDEKMISVERMKKPFYKKWWFWLLVLVFVIGIANVGQDTEETVAEPDEGTAALEAEAAAEEDNADESAEDATEENDTADAEEAENEVVAAESAEEETAEEDVTEADANEEEEAGWDGGTEAEGIEEASTEDEAIEEESDDQSNNQEEVGEAVEEDDAAEEEVEVAATVEETQVFRDGTYLVGDEMEPGIYFTTNGGYYERLSGLSGDFDEIIANNNMDGQAYVEIKESDEAFSTQFSAGWVQVDVDNAEPLILNEFGSGIYIVGVDIEPGRYKIEGDSYWARLSGVSSNFEVIIANDNVTGSGYLEVQESDFAVEIMGGLYTKMD